MELFSTGEECLLGVVLAPAPSTLEALLALAFCSSTRQAQSHFPQCRVPPILCIGLWRYDTWRSSSESRYESWWIPPTASPLGSSPSLAFPPRQSQFDVQSQSRFATPNQSYRDSAADSGAREEAGRRASCRGL